MKFGAISGSISEARVSTAIFGQAHSTAVADPGHMATIGWKADTMHPNTATAGLEYQLPKGHLWAPLCGCQSIFHLLDIGWEDLAFEVTEACVQSTLSGCQFKLGTMEKMDLLMCLPTHQSFSCSKYQMEMNESIVHSKLVLTGNPAHTGSGHIDLQDDKCVALQCPHIGTAVYATCHDAVTFIGPFNACHLSIVLLDAHVLVEADGNLPQSLFQAWTADGLHQEAMVGHAFSAFWDALAMDQDNWFFKCITV